MAQTTNTISSADRFHILRGSGGSADEYDVEYSTLLQYLRNSIKPDVAAFKFIASPDDFPAAVAGVRTLEANTTYYVTTEIDLRGDRLVMGVNTTLLGASSEVSILKSTGLATAFITSNHTMPMRNIAFHDMARVLDLDGDGIDDALDWVGVNFVNCTLVGTVKNYANFVVSSCAFLNSGALTFDESFGTIALSATMFSTATAGKSVVVPATAVISRRLRIIYSSFVTTSGETSLDVSASASIPDESYIIDAVNFSGGGTYLTGVTTTSEKALVVNCVGVPNSASNGQLYMQTNGVNTSISNTTDFFKVAGTTSASSDNSKFSHSNNRLTCTAKIERKYLLQCSLSFESMSNNVCEFGFYDSTIAGVRVPSRTRSTANSGGRAENISFSCVTSMVNGDYIEIHAKNTSAAADITVIEMNLVITEL